MNFDQESTTLELERSKKLAEIETKKFQELIGAIGQETLVAISNAGPET